MRSPIRARPHTPLAQPRERSVFDGGFGKYGSVRGSRRNLWAKSKALCLSRQSGGVFGGIFCLCRAWQPNLAKLTGSLARDCSELGDLVAGNVQGAGDSAAVTTTTAADNDDDVVVGGGG